MPERSEILVWCYVAAHFSEGYKFNSFAYANSKLTKRSQHQNVHLSQFRLIWKSYGKRLIAQVTSDGHVITNIIINMAQFGQVSPFYLRARS